MAPDTLRAQRKFRLDIRKEFLTQRVIRYLMGCPGRRQSPCPGVCKESLDAALSALGWLTGVQSQGGLDNLRGLFRPRRSCEKAQTLPDLGTRDTLGKRDTRRPERKSDSGQAPEPAPSAPGSPGRYSASKRRRVSLISAALSCRC